jgi:carbamoyltransferase
MTKIIGIHNTGVTSSAAILINNQIKFACAEERLTRNKYDKYYPIRAIQNCLNATKLNIDEVDYFAIGWNPAENLKEKIRPGFYEWVSHPGLRLASNANYILNQMSNNEKEFDYTLQEFFFHNKKHKSKKIIFVDHHQSHLANGYFSSKFKDSALLSIDGYGENSTIVIGHAIKNDIKIKQKQVFPNSIGEFYSTVTQFLGFRPNHDEWKIMGMSGYGNYKTYLSKFQKIIKSDSKYLTLLDLNFFNFFNFDSKYKFSKLFIELFGPQRNYGDVITKRHFDLAAAAQKITELLVFDLIENLKKKNYSKNLCLSGGLIMNSVLNGKICKSNIFKNVFIPFSPDDTGNAIGSALWANSKKNSKVNYNYKNLQNPYTGNSFNNSEIKKILDKNKIKYKKINNLNQYISEKISKGKVVAWFQGREEFGQRALGNRSILADPRNPKMKDHINLIIKNRESFRPFAPSILKEYCKDYFEVNEKFESNYMEKTLKFKKNVIKKIPAVVHVDGSGRLQTVSKENNIKFYNLIKEFFKLTGIPILLNTSFNVDGEPIVSNPLDALKNFYSSGLDILVLEDYIIEK